MSVNGVSREVVRGVERVVQEVRGRWGELRERVASDTEKQRQRQEREREERKERVRKMREERERYLHTYNYTHMYITLHNFIHTAGVKKVDRSNLTCKFSNSKVTLKLHSNSEVTLLVNLVTQKLH